MSERTRDFLKPEFRDGERPSGADFGDLIDSFVNKQTDGVSFDSDGNLVLVRGVRLGNSNATVAGGLRFNNNQLQVFTGGAWTNVSGGGGGAFQPVAGSATAVSHDGNVGIGTFAAPPTFRLEVPLGASGGPADQVRFGNAVCGNGSGTFAGFAVFSHQQRTSNNDFALRQSPNGPVHINAPTGQVIGFRTGGTQIRMGISSNGNVVVGSESDLPGAGTAILQVAGGAFKADGSTAWTTISDARIKEDVRDLERGLFELRQVRPVRFRYNGRAGTLAGQAAVGVLGQEIETVLPETIQRASVADDPGLDDMRVFDPSALTYVLINAVKELASRVEHLEQALAAATAATSSGRG
jgi:hypothetical protein